MGLRPAKHHPWEYFVALAPYIRGIERVNLTGGEPTLHPQFAEFVPKFRDLFQCSRLTLSTDGFRVLRYRDIIEKHFDEVHLSDYGTRPAELAHLRERVALLSIYPAGEDAQNFTDRARRGSGAPCERGFSETVAFADGMFWPCCVSPGLEGTRGLVPCLDWRERVQEIDLGCSNCFFSPK